MLVAFSHIFVRDTKIIHGNNFVAPLILGAIFWRSSLTKEQSERQIFENGKYCA